MSPFQTNNLYSVQQSLITLENQRVIKKHRKQKRASVPNAIDVKKNIIEQQYNTKLFKNMKEVYAFNAGFNI